MTHNDASLPHTQLAIWTGLNSAGAGWRAALLEVIFEAGAGLGQALADLINIFNPEKIVPDGPLSIAGDYFAWAPGVCLQAPPGGYTNRRIEMDPSAFARGASLMGAFAIVVDDLVQI
jgi:predicted NBD/HSP70 family sugar kinase